MPTTITGHDIVAFPHLFYQKTIDICRSLILLLHLSQVALFALRAKSNAQAEAGKGRQRGPGAPIACSESSYLYHRRSAVCYPDGSRPGQRDNRAAICDKAFVATRYPIFAL